MKTLRIIVNFFLFFASFAAYSQNNFTVKVVCRVSDYGTLYVSLVDKETFGKPGGFIQQKKYVIPLNNSKQKIEFKFEDVSHGNYGLRFFIDQNNNGIVDIGTFGSKEPWGMSWRDNKKPKFSKPKFEQICWDISSDFIFPNIIVVDK